MFIKFPNQKQAASEIFVGPLAQQLHKLNQLISERKALLLCDTNTAMHCLPVLRQMWPQCGEVSICVLPPGEVHKNLDTCQVVWDRMTALQMDRNSVLLVLGGGVLSDLGGFCAAAFKRGIRFVFLPTTLLSMGDSTIGGKLGVDYKGFKNHLGVFALPESVFIDPAFLSTLPPTELLSGMAEVLKHAAIGDRKMLGELLALTDFDFIGWPDLIVRNIAIKARIVQKDPYEQHLRMVLNFGHTIGHALESYYLDAGMPISHGHAVALGMLAEAKCMNPTPRWASRLSELILRHFDTQPLQDCNAQELWPWLMQDKKKIGSAIRIALPGKRLFTLAEHFWVAPGQIPVW